MKFKDLFNEKPVLGMIHCGCSAELSTIELAKREIDIYLEAGIAPLIENYFGSAQDCEDVLKWIHASHPSASYGINILGDYPLAFELASKYNAKFIQIDSIRGHLTPENDLKYAETLQELRNQSDVVLLGGVRFKYQAVRSGCSVEEDLLIGTERCDAIVCTGEGTGLSTPMQKVHEFKSTLQDFPVIVGAGVTKATAAETYLLADGAIVGSWLKEGHKDIGAVNQTHVADFMSAWH